MLSASTHVPVLSTQPASTPPASRKPLSLSLADKAHANSHLKNKCAFLRCTGVHSFGFWLAFAQSKSDNSRFPYERSVVKFRIPDWDFLSLMEFLDEATSSDSVRADVTGRRGGTNVGSELPCAGV